MTTQLISKKNIKAHHHPIRLMGCSFVLTAVGSNPQLAWDAIRAGVNEIQRIENLISSWIITSETNLINENAGIQPVRISRELFELIQRSLRVSHLTGGAFDISGTLSRYYWNFDKRKSNMLPNEKVLELRDLINYKLIELNLGKNSVFLQKKGMKIGFGGIGKGYAAFRAYQVMKTMGIESGLVNASGDLMCWGTPPQGGQWPIHIPDPKSREQALMKFSIPYGSVVTSGNYENYTLIDGKRHSHIVDPRTGRPVTEVKQVSVLCPNPELGDALATGISVLGVEEGINLIDRLNGVEGIIIDETDKIHYSKHFISSLKII